MNPGWQREEFFEYDTQIRRAQTPEQKRVEANAKLRVEWERERFPLECRRGIGNWCNADGSGWNDPVLEYRRKPEPVYVPWTLATRPDGCVWVKRKGDNYECAVLCWEETRCSIGGIGTRDYRDLFKNWTQRDGTPCGTKGEL